MGVRIPGAETAVEAGVTLAEEGALVKSGGHGSPAKVMALNVAGFESPLRIMKIALPITGH